MSKISSPSSPSSSPPVSSSSCQDDTLPVHLYRGLHSGLIRRTLPLKASENTFATPKFEEQCTKTSQRLQASLVRDCFSPTNLNVNANSKPVVETQLFTSQNSRIDTVPGTNENFPFRFRKQDTELDHVNLFRSNGSTDTQECYKRRRPTSVPIFTAGPLRPRKSGHAVVSENAINKHPSKVVRGPLSEILSPTVLRNRVDHLNVTDKQNSSRSTRTERVESLCADVNVTDTENSSKSTRVEGIESSSHTLNVANSCKNVLGIHSMRLPNSSTATHEVGGSHPKNRIQRSNSLSHYPSCSPSKATERTILGTHHSQVSSSNESTESSSCFSRDRCTSSSSSSSVTSNLISSDINTPVEKSGVNKRSLKYVSARMVAERLVRALTKEKARACLNRSIKSQAGRVLGQEGGENADCRDLNAEGNILSIYELPKRKEKLRSDSRVASKGEKTWSQRLFEAHSGKAEELWFPVSYEYSHLSIDRMGKSCTWIDSFSEDNVCTVLEQRAKAKEEEAALLEVEINITDDQLTLPNAESQSNGETLDSLDVFRHKIRGLRAEKRQLALEVASEIRNRLFERAKANSAFQNLKEETECQMKLLEKDKTDIQQRLEREIERRTAEWLSKMEKIRVEEGRLRERVREMAEEKVGLQKEVSFLVLKESGLSDHITESQITIDKLKYKVQEAAKENEDLKQILAASCKQLQSIKDENDALTRTYEIKERATVDLLKDLARFQKITKDQEKTIGGLWQELDQAVNGGSEDKSEHIINLQRELLRLINVEQALQKELETMTKELAFLKEVNGLNQKFKTVSKASVTGVLQDDLILQVQTSILQSQVMKLQDENKLLSAKLRVTTRDKRDAEMTLEILDLATKGSQQYQQSLQDELGCKRQQRSTQELEKKVIEGRNLENLFLNLELDEECQQNMVVEDVFCKVLHNELLSTEFELEQLHEKHAFLLQNQSWLQTEVDNLRNALYTANQKIQYLEQQLCGKNEDIKILQDALEGRLEELNDIQEELSQVRLYKDEMCKVIEEGNKEVLKSSMEVKMLTKQVEKLEEDLMIKEGQLAILQGTFTDSD